ncbi:MAG TPA: hypothetical protein ENI97_02790 [Gammaproteobacteria bacterium]|nr:hypothetical protein [Gammaproteobacteria bacterium]
MTIYRHSLFLIVFLGLTIFSTNIPAEHRCLLVMSYHKGYAWNDGIEKGVEETLKGRCLLKKFFMDSKRNTSVSFIRKKAAEASALISSFRPDVVIACDDNAAKYLVTQYKGSDIPFVFCGINWTAEEYGFPYKNVTGMIEVVPIVPLLKIIKSNVHNVKHGVYLSSDVITEHKDFKRYKKIYREHGVKLTGYFVKTMKDWISYYRESQKSDFIIVNNFAGIVDWDPDTAKKIVYQHSKKLTVTNYRWMMPYAMLGLTKKPEEHGRWAAQVAIEVLNGTPISNIPITINREWELFVNLELLQHANIKLDKNTLKRASSAW